MGKVEGLEGGRSGRPDDTVDGRETWGAEAAEIAGAALEGSTPERMVDRFLTAEDMLGPADTRVGET